MATYIYETIPEKPGEEPETFEVKQGMMDEPLSKHPETGVAVRRVITGGLGFVSKGKSSPEVQSPPSAGGCCGGDCGCCH